MSDPSRFLRTDHLHADLTRRSLRGGIVTIGAQLLKIVVQFASIVVLARLLTPEAFGLIAMVAVILTVLEMLKDMGLSQATVQRPDITDEQVSALFWVNAALGLAAASLMLPLGPLLAWFYGEPALQPIAWSFAAAYVLSGLSTQHLALLRRQMRFKALSTIQIGAEIVAIAAAVALAAAGAGYWALVAQRIVWASCLVVGGWIACGWRPSRPRRCAGLRDLLGFGANVAGSSVTNMVLGQLDQILIGAIWGAGALGYYERAYKLLMVPISNLNFPLFSVAMPTLSRLAGEPDRYRSAYLRLVDKLNMVSMPAAAMLIAAPDLVVRLLFGVKWLPVAPILGWLGVAALYQPIMHTFGWLLMTQNRTGELLRWGIVCSCITAAGAIAGLPFGAVGVAAGIAISGLTVRLPCQFWVIGRTGPVKASDLYRSMGPSAVAALVVGGTIALLRASPAFEGLSPIEALVLIGFTAFCLALATYVALPHSRRALRDTLRLSASLTQRRANA